MSDCGCCQGIAASTPVEVVNRPGLSAVVYRVGTHAQFKASLLAALSSRRDIARKCDDPTASDSPLRNLRTREDDDFSIALLDAWATVADVLTFYQERIANELFLATALERRSIGWLARLIGYELRPGVAASTWLAYTLETAAGAPSEVTIDQAVKVQSVPGPGEKPQVFEPVEEAAARPEWNALKPRLTSPRTPVAGDLSLYLEGVATNLKAGDTFVLVGLERLQSNISERWDFRRIASVEPDAAAGRTLIRWAEPLGSVKPLALPAAKSVRFYAMRLRAAIFGHNAQQWEALPVALRVGEVNPDPTTSDDKPFFTGAYSDSTKWADAKFATTVTSINLDAVYNQIAPNSWIVLAAAGGAYAELYSVTAVSEVSTAGFNMSAKTSLLAIDGENIQKFSPRIASVFAQSEELVIAENPITDPVSGKEIVLDSLVEGIEAGRRLIVQGKRPRVKVAERDGSLSLRDSAGVTLAALAEGDSLTVMEPRTVASARAGTFRWHVVTAAGVDGYVTGTTAQIVPDVPLADDAVLADAVTLAELAAEDETHTRLVLNEQLANIYDRSSVNISANVLLATHGETVNEVMGSGDPSQAFQNFTLRQYPVTYTSAATPSGGETTLSVWVNNVQWEETPDLFGAAPRDRVYVTRLDDDAKTTVYFGDGVNGERPAKGSENITATYRKGIGLDGLVRASQLTQLMVRPLGVSKVTNPLAASGAQDKQDAEDARANAPLGVLTLDRIVSLRDYEDFARNFSGIAKALATDTWSHRTHGVFLTVAGVDGADVAEASSLYTSLVEAISGAENRRTPLRIRSYRKAYFQVAVKVAVKPEYQSELVLAGVEAVLRDAFSFDSRSFGQPVALSEVIALIQNVEGVAAVNVYQFYRSDQAPSLQSLLQAAAPRQGDDSSAPAAELLTLDSAPLAGLEVMP